MKLGDTAYVALARMAASAGDGSAALRAAEDCFAAGLQPRLRSFAPALLAFATAGQASAATPAAHAHRIASRPREEQPHLFSRVKSPTATSWHPRISQCWGGCNPLPQFAVCESHVDPTLGLRQAPCLGM